MYALYDDPDLTLRGHDSPRRGSRHGTMPPSGRFAALCVSPCRSVAKTPRQTPMPMPMPTPGAGSVMGSSSGLGRAVLPQLPRHSALRPSSRQRISSVSAPASPTTLIAHSTQLPVHSSLTARPSPSLPQPPSPPPTPPSSTLSPFPGTTAPDPRSRRRTRSN